MIAPTVLANRLAGMMLLVGLSASAAPQTIKPGEVWLDDRGQQIQTHGGWIIKLSDNYCWFGEDRSQGLDRAKRYVSCYRSKDLAHWTFCNQVIKLSDPEQFGPRWVLERPKTFYNPKTKSYVMYMHIDDAKYQVARVGVATCAALEQFLGKRRGVVHQVEPIDQPIEFSGKTVRHRVALRP